MVTPFNKTLNETVAIIRESGDKHENVPALVTSKKIIISEVTISLSSGDRIVRSLPSGQVESLIVTNAHLTKGRGGIPDFYSIEYVREGTQQHSGQLPTLSVHVEDSPQARVNLYSADHSTNVMKTQPEEVFSEIRELLTKSVADSNEIDLLFERVEDMERNLGKDSFTESYKDFISAAAAHMTILAPVLPALATLLTSAGG